MATMDGDDGANMGDDFMDDAQPRDGAADDDEVREVTEDVYEQAGASATPNSHMAHTPVRASQPHHAAHHIGTLGTARSRTRHGGTPLRDARRDLAPPPTFHATQPAAHNEPTLSDIMAAINGSKRETLARIDELAAGQAVREETLTRLDAKTTKLDETTMALRRDTDNLAERITALESRTTPTPSPAPSTTPSTADSERNADPHYRDRAIARINTPTPVSMQALRGALDPIFKKPGIAKDNLKILGPQLGKNYVLSHSSGDEHLRQAMVDQLLDARRDDDGRWTPTQVPSPRGDHVIAYLERDTSLAQRRCSLHLTRIARSVRVAKPDAAIEVSRAAQVVTHNWCELANVRFDDATRNIMVEWHDKALQEMGIELQAVHDDYDEQVAAAPAPRARRG